MAENPVTPVVADSDASSSNSMKWDTDYNLVPLLEEDSGETSSRGSSWAPTSPPPGIMPAPLMITKPATRDGSASPLGGYSSDTSPWDNKEPVARSWDPSYSQFSDTMAAGEYHRFAAQLATHHRRQCSAESYLSTASPRRKRPSLSVNFSTGRLVTRRNTMQAGERSATPFPTRQQPPQATPQIPEDSRAELEGSSPVPVSAFDSDSDDEEDGRIGHGIKEWLKLGSEETGSSDRPKKFANPEAKNTLATEREKKMSAAPLLATDKSSTVNGGADPANSSAATTLVIVDEQERQDQQQQQQQQEEESGRDAGVARHGDVCISEGDVADLREAARRASAGAAAASGGGAAAAAAAAAGTTETHVGGAPHVDDHHHNLLHQGLHHYNHHYDQDQDQQQQHRDRQPVHELDADAGADADAQAEGGEASRESLYYEASTMATLNPFSVAAINRLRAYKPPAFPLWDSLPARRRAAVLVLLYADRWGDLRVVITMRAASLRSFSGHAALPGGKADHKDETPYQIARREAYEEIGLPMDDSRIPRPFRIEPLCTLPPSLARTHLVVTPCVAFLHADRTSTPDAPSPLVEESMIPRLDAREVAAVFSAPFYNFLKSADLPPRAGAAALPPGQWYEGSWVAWKDMPWRVHNFYVPVNNQRVSKPSRRDSAQGNLAEKLGEEQDFEGRFKVWGMTGRLLVDAARIAYGEEPEIEHNDTFGDYDIIQRAEAEGVFKEIMDRDEASANNDGNGAAKM
ncbi:NUDIX domain-containing protein [Purpureocillium lavendulum]|uniref:NUDIX domain-containing protein n=1 Tax=Purpureocillium lavendulum TaxID=1247861 RepID=A0AB34G7M0_9HYPO|nr:NUDIX domain-containing protein [Purpureocillium lavendulum]